MALNEPRHPRVMDEEVRDVEWAGVVLDTNVWVAAGFRPRSDSARLLEEVRRGRLRLVWDRATREETEHILRKIPPLSWDEAAPLFREEDRYRGTTEPEWFGHVEDPADRKFAALAEAAGVPLVSMDEHLLSQRSRIAVPVLTPSESLRRHRPDPAADP